MAAEDNGEYAITWDTKPLGFSIVMDTTGRNAYVSSIQKQSNLEKGLKLAAQIIKINGDNVKQMKHGEILEKIRSAELPMTLTFQPRSFANEPSTTRRNEMPEGLLFSNAPEGARNRVDGIFERVTQPAELANYNSRNVWQRKDEEEDPILLWYWPKGVSNLPKDLWMISRHSQIGKQGAYACCESSEENPLNIRMPWKIYNKTTRVFDECTLEIADGVNPNTAGAH